MPYLYTLVAPGIPVGSDILKVEGGRDHLDVLHRELGALSNDVPIDDNGRTAIIVETLPITALLIGKQVDTSSLEHNSHILYHGFNLDRNVH